MRPSPLARLFRLFAPERGTMALAVALQVATIAAGVGLMATSAWLIARAAERPSIAALSLAVVGVRAFGIGRGVLRYLERLVAHDVTLALLARLRGWLYDALEPLAPARLLERRSGDLAARIIGDVDALEPVQVRLIGPTLAAGLVVLLTAALLLPRGPLLAVVAALGFVAGGAGGSWLAWRAGRRASAGAVALRGELEARTVDDVQGLAELVTFGRATAHAEIVERLGDQLRRAQVRSARAASLGGALVGLAADVTAVAVLALAIAAAGAGTLDPVQLAVVTLLTLAAFEAALPLPAAWQALGAARAAAARIFELVDADPSVVPPAEPAPAPRGGHWQLRLSFGYPGSPAPTLRDVALELAAGRLVAVVGSSGAGKSTILSLLLRFWEVPPGSILIDGSDVRRHHPDDVRRLVASMPQRTQLFTGTLAENLRIARPSASAGELMSVLDAAGLRQLVERLPAGLETWIGERGLELSGGEGQRLALARALLKPAPLLVLDEPTAHVDALTERALLQTILAAARDRAVLLITHRLAGLETADEIVVLASGRVVERGTWDELVGADGAFARMLRLERGIFDRP